jgi:hypothetical protein
MTNTNKEISTRANSLAERIALGAKLLANLAEGLSDSDWKKPVFGDGRTIGVVVHHVASAYPVEIELAQNLASGNPITGVTKDVVDKMNAEHAKEFKNVGRQETLELLKTNSSNAAESVRTFTDSELDNSASVSLNADAPLTTQFFIEDHALRHSFHHLAKIQQTLSK